MLHHITLVFISCMQPLSKQLASLRKTQSTTDFPSERDTMVLNYRLVLEFKRNQLPQRVLSKDLHGPGG